MGSEEIEEFDLLEQKVESLISVIGGLAEQRVTLERKLKSQQEEIDSLRNELQTLRSDRELVQKRIARLLQRIAECDL
jgi:septal ring factor EnvC (AmiA/AmiB activator)